MPAKNSSMGFTEEESSEIIALARGAIEMRLAGEPIPVSSRSRPKLRQKTGVFVTLRRNGALRGCIGYIEGMQPLVEAIPRMAVAAAFEDPRFPPLSKGELKELQIEVTILSPLKKIKDTDEIKVGKHGILIRSGYNQGLLLPQVAVEENWDLKTFLMHTCLKAGLNPDAYKRPGTEIFIFEGVIISEPHRKQADD